jgi:hypothetical protein
MLLMKLLLLVWSVAMLDKWSGFKNGYRNERLSSIIFAHMKVARRREGRQYGSTGVTREHRSRIGHGKVRRPVVVIMRKRQIRPDLACMMPCRSERSETSLHNHE